MKILFMGGDVRMIYAAEALSDKYDVNIFKQGDDLGSNPKFDLIILPLPLSGDGKTIFSPSSEPIPFDELRRFADERTLILSGGSSKELSQICSELGSELIDYFASEALTLRNAALTAEAAASLFITESDGALLGSSTLITGSGRIAFFLAERLRAFGSSVTIAARNRDKRTLARLNGYGILTLEAARDALPSYDYIANTVPARLFADADFAAMKKTVVFQELASLPERPNSEFAGKYGIKYIHAGGLPGKYSPRAAGKFIASEVESIISSRENNIEIQAVFSPDK